LARINAFGSLLISHGACGSAAVNRGVFLPGRIIHRFYGRFTHRLELETSDSTAKRYISPRRGEGREGFLKNAKEILKIFHANLRKLQELLRILRGLRGEKGFFSGITSASRMLAGLPNPP